MCCLLCTEYPAQFASTALDFARLQHQKVVDFVSERTWCRLCMLAVTVCSLFNFVPMPSPLHVLGLFAAVCVAELAAAGIVIEASKGMLTPAAVNVQLLAFAFQLAGVSSLPVFAAMMVLSYLTLRLGTVWRLWAECVLRGTSFARFIKCIAINIKAAGLPDPRHSFWVRSTAGLGALALVVQAAKAMVISVGYALHLAGMHARADVDYRRVFQAGSGLLFAFDSTRGFPGEGPGLSRAGVCFAFGCV